jgi:tetratricopeptide (TPR) repeat protein
MTHINKALRIDDQLKKGYFLKGLIYKERGDTTLAISSLQTVIELDPNDKESFLLLGLIHAAQKDPIALDYYNSAIDADPNNVEARYNKGLFYQESGDAESALEQYEEILNIDNNYAVAHYNMGYVYMSLLSETDLAIEQFTLAIEKNPNYYQAYYNRGYCKETAGDYEAAQKDYKNCLNISANHPLAIAGLNRTSSP